MREFDLYGNWVGDFEGHGCLDSKDHRRGGSFTVKIGSYRSTWVGSSRLEVGLLRTNHKIQ